MMRCIIIFKQKTAYEIRNSDLSSDVVSSDREAGWSLPKTHDLGLLLKRSLPAEPLWGVMEASLKALTDFAAASRYPGEWADRTTATEAYATCLRFRKMRTAERREGKVCVSKCRSRGSRYHKKKTEKKK